MFKILVLFLLQKKPETVTVSGFCISMYFLVILLAVSTEKNYVLKGNLIHNKFKTCSNNTRTKRSISIVLIKL